MRYIYAVLGSTRLGCASLVDLSTPFLLGPADWAIIAGTFGLALVSSLLVLWATRKYLEEYTRRTATKVDDIIVSLLKGPVVFFVVAYGAIWLARTLVRGSPIQASSSLFDSLNLAYVFIVVLVGTWVAAKLFVIIAHRYVQRLALKTQSKLDDLMAGVFARAGRILILLVGIAVALGLLWMAIGLLRLASGLN